MIDNSDYQETTTDDDPTSKRAPCNCNLDEEDHKCESPEPPPDVPKWYLAVYVGSELWRFIIPTSYLTHSLFKLLLEKAEDEFGFNHNGALTIPCEPETFKYLLRCIETNYDTHQGSSCKLIFFLIFYVWSHHRDQLQDQVETNKALFGVKSTFDEELYTTKLEKGPRTRELEKQALRIAREIEGEETQDLHLAELTLVKHILGSGCSLLRHYLIHLLLGEPGTGGSSTPSMVGAVKKWQKSDPQKSLDTWRRLSEANSQLEIQLNSLSKLAKEQWDAYKFVIDSCSKLRSEKWIEQASEPNKEAVIKALLGAKEAMLGIRYHMHLMGEAAGIPIEPESQTKLLDATLNLEGVLLAGVPGVGGFDVVFAVTLGDSSSNVTKTWSSLNVLALLVKEDPCGVSLESADPRTNEITSAVSSIHIE
ncbi:uncharacterized protein LOC130939580 [Arachis stenosperma]|uniref:uncharacterized protein LOC130939580 n=1 Tax=Arachis stenosperma TaxID=217475 RepID=UPI0025AD86B1|nr:uncharacterized protein LOC130939580 [Arachis stenosperma]